MTSLITRSVVEFLKSTNYDAISTTVGVAAVVALLILFIEREAVRAYGAERSSRWIRGLDIAALPLLSAFGIIVFLRLLQLLP